jgi:hypothetical protein
MHPAAPPPVTVVSRPVKIAQLVGDFDRQRQQPTANRTETRYHLVSTDLGVPFQHHGRTYLLFGDTFGPPGGDAIAFTTDRSPEDGLDLTFIHEETGVYRPVQIPGVSQGDFEVPMAGTSVAGRMYVYHTTDHSEKVAMGRSVVAVSEDDGRSFRYLYDLSTRQFINVSVVQVTNDDWQGLPRAIGTGLLLFGSGKYRQSSVRLAFQPAEQIEERASLRYFAGSDAAGKPIWSEQEWDAEPFFDPPVVGELSVTYNRFLRQWLMLYNVNNGRNAILFRTAEQPWGPWSEARTLFDPRADHGYGQFMHAPAADGPQDALSDPGREAVWGDAYGPYQFPEFATGHDSATTIYFTLSTWNPYTVVLMKATLKRE